MSAGSITHATLPAGMIAPFGMSSVPSGWIVCNGATYNSVSDTEYAALFSAIGTTWGGTGASSFKVPDLEGAFLRGIGTNATHTMADGNLFAGPTNVGDFENDQFQGHKHNINVSNGDGSNALPGGTVNSLNRSANSASGDTAGVMVNTISAGANGSPRTGDETRPFNAGVKYCIKF